MILRYDRIGIEIPPCDPDPAGAMAVQELMRGRFGEMSTLMNYTFQSFNFRGRTELRPFYDLIANIAAEEYGHIEVVGATITAMLSGAGARQVLEQGNPHHVLKAGKGVLPVDSGGAPWTGDYVFSSGDLVEDLTHNFFLETGARNGKLKVYEAVDHPAARALTGYLLVRGCVHQVAYGRALELLTGADLTKTFPMPRIPTDKIPECRPHLERGSHLTLYRFTPDDYNQVVAVFKGAHPETGEQLRVQHPGARGLRVAGHVRPRGRVRTRLRARRDRGDRPEAAQGRRLQVSRNTTEINSPGRPCHEQRALAGASTLGVEPAAAGPASLRATRHSSEEVAS
jgi:Mn-containing catalase